VSPADLAKYAEVMVRFGIGRLVVDGVTIERPAMAPMPDHDEKKPDDEATAGDDADELTKIQLMSPDAQDARLMLGPTRRP